MYVRNESAANRTEGSYGFGVPSVVVIGLVAYAAAWALSGYTHYTSIDEDGVPWFGGKRAFFDASDPTKDVCPVCLGTGMKAFMKPCDNCWKGFVYPAGGIFLTAAVLKKILGKKH